MSTLPGTLMPFLYPCLFRSTSSATRSVKLGSRLFRQASPSSCRPQRHISSLAEINAARRAAAHQPDPVLEAPAGASAPLEPPTSRLNPPPDEYSRNVFVDKCTVTVHAGSGGNGCVSFLREAYVPDGPPNGGDGGLGGNVWIQAVPGQTSLHKLARRGTVKAGRGIGGQGKSQSGKKGEDVCIQVPVGTVIREISRSDPVAEEESRFREMDPHSAPLRNKYIMYAGSTGREAERLAADMPAPQKPRRGPLTMMEPEGPITLDLDQPMERPMLLAAGAIGGLGNPHFASKDNPKPKFATKGELGVRIKLEMELKLLADVGLVGLPNAGKSTLLRAISNSRTRVGDWAFTTLEPSIGTVILDNNEGRPSIKSGIEGEAPRTSFTVADIPGLIEDAHLDKGLGLGFLRHVERARILAFVIDLSARDPVTALQNLWKEVGEYENLRNIDINEQSENRTIEWSAFSAANTGPMKPQSAVDEDGQPMIMFPEPSKQLEPLKLPPISAKPWFVVATKADKEGTQQGYMKLRQYVEDVEAGREQHPSGKKNSWRARIAAIPVSAIRGEGTDRIAEWTAGVLDSLGGAGAADAVVETETRRSRVIEATA